MQAFQNSKQKNENTIDSLKDSNDKRIKPA